MDIFGSRCWRSWVKFLAVGLAFGCFSLIGPANDSLGQAFERGYQAFQNGDYRKARSFLSRGLRQTKDRYDKALMYKLIGISEIKLGSRSRGASAFKKALQLDPSLRINREESRDRRVLGVFAKVKRAMRGGRGMSSRRMGSRSRRAARASRSRMQSTRSSAGGGSLLLNLAPLGIGQFAQGKTFLGAAVAGGQIAGAFIFIERTNAANQADQDALDVINDYEQNGEASGIDETAFLQYLDENEAFVKKAKQDAQMGLFIALGFYAGGVAEAILNPPEPPRRRRGRRGRRRGDLPQSSPKLAQGEVLDTVYYSPSAAAFGSHWNFDMARHRGQAAGVMQYSFNF